VVVGMAFNCVTAGDKHCEISSDLFDLLVDKRVDLVLQGHEHGYERSGQFALNPTTCPAIPISDPTGTPSYSAGCEADNGSSGNYAKGAGPVVVIAGTAGIALRPMNRPGSPDAPEAPYFATLMGNNGPVATHGFTQYPVTASQLTGTFVSENDGQKPVADSFAITGAAGSTPGSPTAEPGTGPAAPGGRGANGAPPASGYWMLSSPGHVYGFGAAADHGGADGRLAPGARAAHLEPTPSGNGYWIVDTAGQVVAAGDAPWLGDVPAG